MKGHCGSAVQNGNCFHDALCIPVCDMDVFEKDDIEKVRFRAYFKGSHS